MGPFTSRCLRLSGAILAGVSLTALADLDVVRAIQDDGQPGPADQRAERAAELADDERRLRLDALLEAHADQPRQRQEPADGLGAGARRHAGRRAERSGERGQSAHRQRLHVHDRRLGHDLQDRRAQSRPGRVRLGRRSRREARGQRAAHARHRAVGRPGDRQPSRRPRDRDQPRQRRDRVGQDGRRARTNSAARRNSSRRRSPPTARSSSRTARATPARAAGSRRSTRRPATSCGAGTWCRSRAIRAAKPGRTRHNAWKTGGGGIWQTGSYDPGDEAHHLGHRQPGSDLRSAVRVRATTSTPTRSSRSTSTPASSPGTSSTRRTTRGTTTRSASTCSTTRRSTASRARSSATSRATASSTRSIAPTASSSRAASTSTI